MMEKTKKYIQEQYDEYDNLYWDTMHKCKIKEDQLQILQNEVNSLKSDMNAFKNKRDHYEELLNELDTTNQ